MNRRHFLKNTAATAAGFLFRAPAREFHVRTFGAKGDGVAEDTHAIQAAIDAAAAAGGGARVIVGDSAKYLIGALWLKSNIEFHLADGSTLLANPDASAYLGVGPGVLNAEDAVGLKITGSGHIDGQAMKFMTTYSSTDERWEPVRFRPRMFSLHRCKDLEIAGISFGQAPFWGLHLLGCERVLVDGVKITNFMDVPNCDGIDPDHCRQVEIRNCDIASADDCIVVKTSDQRVDYGPSSDIVVKDCRVTSRDSGVKIGTETFADISKIRFERCTIRAGRGPTITHRQRGNISDVEFRDIDLVAEQHAARWWGSGEAANISVRARAAGASVGKLRDIRLRNVRGTAENSFRIDGSPDNVIEKVLLENVDITIDKWTRYPGGKFDNRPTMPGVDGLEAHDIPAFSVRNANGVILKNCKARWGKKREPYYGGALEIENVENLDVVDFDGTGSTL